MKFDANEWKALTPSERVHRCRSWAAEAQARAEKAQPELKQIYQGMADQWATLAREIELQSNRGQLRLPLGAGLTYAGLQRLRFQCQTYVGSESEAEAL